MSACEVVNVGSEFNIPANRRYEMTDEKIDNDQGSFKTSQLVRHICKSNGIKLGKIKRFSVIGAVYYADVEFSLGFLKFCKMVPIVHLEPVPKEYLIMDLSMRRKGAAALGL